MEGPSAGAAEADDDRGDGSLVALAVDCPPAGEGAAEWLKIASEIEGSILTRKG